MKTTFCIATFALLTSAHAACEFPYYPEYADVFAKVEEVTPLLAKKELICHHFWGPPDAVVCEPLRIRDVAGMPVGFVGLTYGGDDADVPRRWNALARKLNAGERVPAEELAAEISSVAGAGGFNSFALFGGYDFAPLAPIGGSGGFTSALSGFRNAWGLARAELGTGELYFKRVVGVSLYHIQSFEFEDASGATMFVECDKYFAPHGADREELHAYGRERAKSFADLIARLEEKGTLEEKRRQWREVDAYVPDDYARQELPRMMTPRRYVVTPELAREAALWFQREYYPEEDYAYPRVSEAKVFYDYERTRKYYAVYLYFGPGDMPTWETLEREAGAYLEKVAPFRSFVIPADKRETFDLAGKEWLPLTLYPHDAAEANLRRLRPGPAWKYERTFLATDRIYFVFRAGDERVITDVGGCAVAAEDLPRLRLNAAQLDIWREIDPQER